MLFAMASQGLPGLGNFIGEFLVLLGVFKVSPVLAILAAAGFITSCVYSLWIVQRTIHGQNPEGWDPPDLSIRETAVMAAMSVLIVGLGLFPQPVFTAVRTSIGHLRQISDKPQTAPAPQIGLPAAACAPRGENP